MRDWLTDWVTDWVTDWLSDEAVTRDAYASKNMVLIWSNIDGIKSNDDLLSYSNLTIYIYKT